MKISIARQRSSRLISIAMPLKSLIRNSIFYKPVARLRERAAERAWIDAGCSSPAPGSVKRRILEHHLCLFGIDTLIETGTYLGDTVEFFRQRCKRIASIELNPQFASAARARFRNAPHVTILEGDSGALLAKHMAGIAVPVLFWLDGHYSGGSTARGERDTPIDQELDAIFAHPVRNHVILIDDARHFTGTDGYPSLDALRARLKSQRPDYSFNVELDIIRCCPPRTSAAMP